MEVLGGLRKFVKHHFSTPGAKLSEPSPWPMVREYLLCFFLVILVFHVYAQSKDGPFVFDDLHNIVDNSHIHISSLDWDSLQRAAFESPIPTRPIANISFSLNYYFDQLDPKSFRLVNVLIHLGNGLLLLLFLKATMQTPVLHDQYRSRNNRFLPFAAVTIWIVNPVHTQSVSYIVQRMTSMAVFFYLLAFLLYIHARLSQKQKISRLLLGCSTMSFLFALGSKENSVTLPFFIFLYEWYFFRDLDYGWLKKNLYWLLIISIFWAGMACIYLTFNPIISTSPDYQIVDLTFAQRIMTQSRVIIFYVFLLLFPHPSRLNLDHHFSVSVSPLDPPTTLLAMLAICALLLIALRHARRERFLSFCILWFLGNLVIESSVAGLDLVFEHRTYLPSVLISMAIVMFLYKFVTHEWLRRGVLLVFVAIGTLWTHDRNIIWADNISLWADVVKKSPAKARPHSNLGIAYGELGQLEKSIHYLRQAVHLRPDYIKPRFNLAYSLLRKGDYPQAEHHARDILGYTPNDSNVLNILAMSLVNQNRLKEALGYFYRAVQLKPDDAYTHFYISRIMEAKGEFEEAVLHCSKALTLKPDYPEAKLHLRQVRQRIKLHTLPNDKPFS